MVTYADIIGTLTMPTRGQTREFAAYVTGAHSWYKHLPIDPPSPFVFYLDPNAGRTMVRVSENEVTFVDNTDEREKFHYTWQTTEAYRRRFGFWNHIAPYGRTFQYETADGIADTAGSGLTVLSSGGESLPIPEVLARAGTAPLSALMWYPTWRPEVNGLHQFDQEMRIGCILYLTLPFGDSPFFAEDRERLKRLMPVLPDQMTNALNPLMAHWEDETYKLELAETFRAYHEYTEAERAKGRYGEASTVDPGFILYTEATKKWEMTASRARERMLLAPLIAAFDWERKRQIDLIVSAMSRFIEMLHAAGDIEGPLH